MNKNILLLYGNIKDLNDLNQDISFFRKNKSNQYRFIEDKKRCILAEVLLKEGLKEFNIYDEEIEYTFNKYEKPYLKNHKDIFFNYSHSGDFVVCAISNIEIGVDIEKIKNCDMKIAEKCFHKNEYELLNNSNNKDIDFYKIWTYKESYIKAIGKGIYIDLNSFDITNIKDYCFKEINIANNYKCVICSKDNLDIRVNKWK